MGFKFGGIKESTKPKDITSTANTIDYIVKDHYTGDGDYFLFVVDKMPSIVQKVALIKEIERFTSNYKLVVAVDCLYNADTLKGHGISEFYQVHKSPWQKLVDFNGQHAKAIMAFGGAMYSANGSADILPDDFLADKFIRPYYYLGHEVWRCDTHIFPVHPIDDLYPRMRDPSSSNINYKTRFFYKQVEQMTDGKKKWTPMLDEVNCISLDTYEEIKDVLEKNQFAELLAFDTETNSLQFYNGKLHCIQLCWNGVDSYFILWKHFEEHPDLKVCLYNNFVSCRRITGTNEKFDMKFLWANGVPLFKVTDATDMACHCIHSDRSKGLKPSSYFFTHFGGYDIPLDKWKKSTGCSNYTKVPQEILMKYACKDSAASWRVQMEADALMEEIDSRLPNEKPNGWPLRRWYEMMMMPIYTEVAKVEYKGIYVNMDLINKNRKEMLEDIKEKEAFLKKKWGLPDSFNLGSSPELAKLFERMGWTDYGRSKDGLYLTGGEAMTLWMRDGHKELEVLRDLKNERSCVNSFLGVDDGKRKTGWMQYEAYHEEDNSWRIHHGYLIFGTTSFRFIGKEPNFQNIPTSGTYAPKVKSCIDTPTDDLIVLTSESGKEYRLADFEYILTDKGYKKAKDVLEEDTIIEDDPDRKTTIRYELIHEPVRTVLPLDSLFSGTDIDAIGKEAKKAFN